MKDISQFIDFSQKGELPHRSIRSLLNLPCTVLEWRLLDSRFKDRDPGKYARMRVQVGSGEYIVNTGSSIIMEQLAAVERAMDEKGETERGFTCIVKNAGSGVKMYPLDWGRNDVRKEERAEA